MDIGSIFPLYELEIEGNAKELVNWSNRLSLCRESLLLIAEKHFSNRIVLIPAYTCSTVYEPFLQNNWNCIFYRIKKDLTIDIHDLLEKYLYHKASVCIIHPYYGMDFSDIEKNAIREIQKNGCTIVEDITQSLFKPCNGISDYYVGSLRKWFAVPDGAFIYSKKNDIADANAFDEFSTFVQDQLEAMYLRGVFFRDLDENIKKISIRLNKRAVETSYGEIKPHRISKVSDFLLGVEDFELQTKRLNNYRYLFENISFNSTLTPVVKEINRVKYPPLYFPVYCIQRSELQNYLAMNHIYAPVLWPKGTLKILDDDDTMYIYDNILVIPIDQRYEIEDMKRICDVINSKEFAL